MYDGDDDFIFLATNFIALLAWLFYYTQLVGLSLLLFLYTCVGFGLHRSAGFGLHWITIKIFRRGVKLCDRNSSLYLWYSIVCMHSNST